LVEVRGEPPGRRGRLTDQGSRFGLRGREALGSELTAWFQLETAFAIDSPGTFAGRNSAVGLEGPLGTVLLGRWESAFNTTQTSIVDPFSDNGLPDITGAAVNQGNFARRERNVVQYWSPRISGFQTRINFATTEDRTADANPHDYGAALSFFDTVTFLAIAFERHKDQVGSRATPGSDEEGLGVSGYHNVGPLKIFGQLGRYRRTGTVMQKSYLVAIEAVSAGHALIATYQNSRNGADFASAAQPSCDLLGAAYRYRFSRRAFFIAEYARVNNKVGALCNFGANPLAITAGQDLRGIAAGARVRF
jgi:predicted porin